MARLTFVYVTQTLTNPKGLSALRRTQFHLFNPLGAYATKKAADQLVSDAVAAGLCKSGAILAFGSGNDFHSSAMFKLALKKRPDGWAVDYHAKKMVEDAMQAIEYVNSCKPAKEA